MSQSEKYYYINSSSARFEKSLFKWNERFTIDVVENYEWIQYIDIYLLKYKDKLDKPKTSNHKHLKPVLKELFEDYYLGALRFIAEKEFDDWEYYILGNNNKWIEIEAYSGNDSKIKGCIKFEIGDNIEDVIFSVYASEELRGRPSARKHGTPITYEHFRQFFNLSLQYLSDHESLLIYYEQFIANFHKLISGKEKKVELFDVSAEKSFKQIISQLENRKHTIEKRLIETDKDSMEKRIQLRGELEGIIYSLKTINIYK